MHHLFLLLLGFIPLVFGANILVDSASSLAKKLNIPNIVIGLTIVAFGTSAPEMVVNVFAALEKSSSIVMGNVIGSNIFNVLVILGISALIYPLAVKSNTTWIEVPLSFLAALVVFVLAGDRLIDGTEHSIITRIDGIILLFFFIIFLVYNISMMLQGSYSEEVPVKDYSIPKSIVLIFTGLALLVLGGKLIVGSSTAFARYVGISERIIALTIVSIGTSLPELATSAMAARKKNVDIAIGNIVGSNIFNIFFILGISSVISPVPVQPLSNLDMLVNMAASLLLFIFIFTGKGRKLERWEALIFLSGYVAYVAALLSV